MPEPDHRDASSPAHTIERPNERVVRDLCARRLGHRHDTRLLALVARPLTVPDNGHEQLVQVDPRHAPLPEPERGSRWSTAIVDGDLLDWPNLRRAAVWLGALRDRLADETLVVVTHPEDAKAHAPEARSAGRPVDAAAGRAAPSTETVALAALLAHGFQRLPDADDTPPAGAPRVSLFRVALYDYKPVPDWLNARFWAHPERWGKAFW